MLHLWNHLFPHLYTFKHRTPVLSRGLWESLQTINNAQNVTKINIEYDRWNHEDLELRPILNTTVRIYSSIWLLGNQAHVYQWWICFLDFGITKMGNCFPQLQACVTAWYGQVVMTEDNKQASIKCIIYIESNFFLLEDVDTILELEQRD